jgi:hypothetical protein
MQGFNAMLTEVLANRRKFMTRIRALILGLLCVVVLATNLMAVTYTSGQVGTCLKFYTNLGPTIQGAVNQMAPGGVLYVCPGVYNEQVVITQPLTLNGVATTNNPPSTAASVVIASPPGPGGAYQNTTSLTSGLPIAAQLLINGVTTGDVNIYNLTVDGNNNLIAGNYGCGLNLIGIYYRNASGTASYVNAINQAIAPPDNGCQTGLGIFVQSKSPGTSTVTVANSYVANYTKNGITANEPGTTATITTNTVFGVGPTTGAAGNGIQFGFGAQGSAKFNTVMDNVYSPGNAGAAGILVYASADIVSDNNVVGNNQLGIAYASDPTYGGADSGTINSNHVYATHLGDGIDVCGNSNTVNSNVVTGSDQSAIHLDNGAGLGGCLTSPPVGNSNTVQSNVIANACAGILEDPGITGNTVTGNFFNTVTNTIAPGPTCGTPLSPANGKQQGKAVPVRP